MIEIEKNIKKQPEPKNPTNGSVFKKKHGYSKTQKRLLRKHGVKTIEEYKSIRKERKLKEKKVRQEKHKASKIYHATHKKVRQGKGGKSAKNTAQSKAE